MNIYKKFSDSVDIGWLIVWNIQDLNERVKRNCCYTIDILGVFFSRTRRVYFFNDSWRIIFFLTFQTLVSSSFWQNSVKFYGILVLIFFIFFRNF